MFATLVVVPPSRSSGGTIRTSNVDVDTKTDRKGRPYSLVCTKNQASYERRAAQRKQDLQDITQLDG